jgi:hypothetical protein
MKTLNSNKNKIMIIIIVLITSSFEVKASNFLSYQNGSLNFECILPIICVGILALLLFTAFLRQKSN